VICHENYGQKESIDNIYLIFGPIKIFRISIQVPDGKCYAAAE